MSRSNNSRKGRSPQLRRRPVPYGEEQHRRVLSGQPTPRAARAVQAANDRLHDSADDGGAIYTCDCCGPMDARGWQIDMTDGIRTFTCKACGERCHEEEDACWVVATGEPHDPLACTEEAWVRFHAEA